MVSNELSVTDCDLWAYLTDVLVVTDPTTGTQTSTTYDLFKCKRCKIGQTGYAKDGYVANCSTKIIDCVNEEILNYQSPYQANLDATNRFPLQNLTSCFRCYNSKIPVLFINSSLDYEPFVFNQADGTTMVCLNITPIDFNLAADAVMTSIVSNCGQVVYFVNQTTNSADLTNAQRNIFCSACLPGFSPEYTNQKISKCNPITNCKTSAVGLKFYNICHQCEDNFRFKFDFTQMTYDYTVCEAVPTGNCDLFDTTNQVCKRCK